MNDQKFALGAFLNEVDNRDIPFAAVVGISQPTDPYIEIPNFLATPRFEQGPLGTCVEHAFEFVRRVDDKIPHSRRVPYVITRNALGWTEANGQGLPQREAAKTNTTVGTPKEAGLDDNTLPHPLYTSLAITAAMIQEANIYRFGGFAFPSIDVNGIKQALAAGKLVAVTVGIDWGAIDPDGTLHAPKTLAGYHEIVIGISDDKTRKFRFANWWGAGWGTQGDGFIPYDEINAIVNDAIAFTVIPEDLLARAKQYQYIFTADLSFGSNSDANIQLQRRLASYGLFTAPEDRHFGLKTLQAVKSYQKLKGLPQTGFVGPMTRTALNNDAGNLPVKKSRLDLWIEAITIMENADPKIHNQGDIRYVGQKEAIGHTAKGICIFPDDPTGYRMLREMLIRAMTGGSSLYDPEETINEFYAGVPVPNRFGRRLPGYAPASDGNDPVHYAQFVAGHIGVDPNVAIKTLLV